MKRGSLVALALIACRAIAPASAPAPARAPDGPDASAAAATVILPGYGNCAKDDDCELTITGVNCCHINACEPYATSKADFAARQKRLRCATKDMQCPNVSPCPSPRYDYDGAACVRGVCAAIARSR